MRNAVIASVMAILITGAALRVLADGTLGDTPKKVAKFITSGYGSV